jgi:hypothetical protein
MRKFKCKYSFIIKRNNHQFWFRSGQFIDRNFNFPWMLTWTGWDAQGQFYTKNPGIFSSTFLLPVYGSKYSIFNWVLKLNLPPQWFFFTIFFYVNVPLSTFFLCSDGQTRLWKCHFRRSRGFKVSKFFRSAPTMVAPRATPTSKM